MLPFPRSNPVGADALIGPLFSVFPRVDLGIDPYGTSFPIVRFPNLKPSASGFKLERKTEPMDMELSGHLRKPRKRNGIGFV